MKKSISMLLITALMLSMIGCGKTTEAETEPATDEVATANVAEEPSTQADPEPTTETTKTPEMLNETISFWYCYTDKVQENNVNLTAEFNETVGKELGITVNAEYQGDYATMSQKLKAAYVAGTAPAVTVMDISMLQPYAKSGVLQELDTFIERDSEEVNMEDFQPAFTTDSVYNGVTYSLPYLRSTPILFLNTTLLEEAGLDTAGPATWEELIQYAATIKEETGKYGMTVIANAWLFQAFMMEYGSSLYNEDATATNINTEEAKKVISNISQMIEDGSANVLASTQSDSFLADITSQNSAMWFYSTGGLTTFVGLGAKSGFDVNTAFLPIGTVSDCPTGGANLVMTSNLTDNQKEAAWQFIKWMTAKEQAIKASTTTGYLPSRISAANDSSMQELYTKMPQFKVVIDQLENAGGTTPSTTEADAAIVSALDSIWVNNADVDTTLAEVEEKVNQILNQK